MGPTLSFRGIDNASYYRLLPEKRYYNNDAGTGNTLNLRHPRVTQMITNSLRYWAVDMHIDGFRFDLGTTLARPEENFDDHSAFLIACIQDPILAHVRLIAEPWDCGPGGYQAGRFPPGWAEWNDKFRDAVRDFWRQDASAGVLTPHLCASADVFDHRGRKPWASVNFVTAHDGFTMLDLVSYNTKHNEANGEDNRDGSSNDHSSNYGVEGPSDDPAIVALRDRQIRNMLATLLLSQGTPMLLAGDEFGRTQAGNNNAYCQDSGVSWIDWDAASQHQELTRFVRHLVALRHELPLLRQNRFLTGTRSEVTGLKDVTWLIAAGTEITPEQWTDSQLRCFGMLLAGAPAPCLLLINAGSDSVTWTLPVHARATRWSLRLDTSQSTEDWTAPWLETSCELNGRSLMLLQAEPWPPSVESGDHGT
jgi:glycogen operon protein